MVTKIEQQTMAGVGTVYAMRRLTSRTAFEVYGLALSFWGVVYFVSLPHVLSNLMHVASGGVPGITAFALSAVLGAKLVVQAALLIGALAVVSLVANTLRSVSRGSLAA